MENISVIVIFLLSQGKYMFQHSCQKGESTNCFKMFRERFTVDDVYVLFQGSCDEYCMLKEKYVLYNKIYEVI